MELLVCEAFRTILTERTTNASANSAWPNQIIRWILVVIILGGFGLRLWGIERDLPYSPAVDEPERVITTLRMASKGDLNPEYFNHPSSTVIYPLLAIYHFWNVIYYEGQLFQANSRDSYYAHLDEYYRLGRYLTVVFATLSIPLIYQLGRKAFRPGVGLIGAGWWVLFPGIAYYSQVVRDDIAATFFGLLGLYACLQLYDRFSWRRQALAGVSIGLAIATRYFMVALIPILLAVDLIHLWREKSARTGWKEAPWGRIITGLFLIPATFAVTTPYFFLDFQEALSDVLGETRTEQLGADGLSPPENLGWYLTEAIPAGITLPFALLAAVGVVFIIYRRRLGPLLLVGFAGLFLLQISLPALHWERWLIQILPLLALFAAEGLVSALQLPAKFLKWGPATQRVVVVAAVCLLSIQPVRVAYAYGLNLSKPSTGVQARYWIIEHLPPGSKIAQEAYTVPLGGTHFVVEESPRLASEGYTLQSAYQAGYRYIIVQGYEYVRYLSEPERYQAEIRLYESLFDEAVLIQEFNPSDKLRGPNISIFELKGPE